MKGALMLAATSLLLVVLLGCGDSSSTAQAPAKDTVVKEGTPIKLMLMRQLHSGDAEDSEVPLLVAEDVKGDNGEIAIPKGSVATGKVSWSRKADAMSDLVNRPARLAVKVDFVKLPNGQTVPLKVDTDNEEEGYHFTRGNTGKSELAQRIEDLANTDEGKQLLERLGGAFEGDIDLDNPEQVNALKEAVQKLNMPQTKELIEKGELAQAQALLQKMRTGENLLTDAVEQLTGLNAVMEIATLATGAVDQLGRIFKGRNITAYVGTPVPARVATTTTIKGG